VQRADKNNISSYFRESSVGTTDNNDFYFNKKIKYKNNIISLWSYRIPINPNRRILSFTALLLIASPLIYYLFQLASSSYNKVTTK
jgi:hypothetical protein